MGRALYFLLLFVGAVTFPSHAQITTATGSTPSVCYNDGTLIVNATGGQGPYTDSILSGPVNLNLTYPIALPVGRDTFIDLPHGTFTIRAHSTMSGFTIFLAGYPLYLLMMRGWEVMGSVQY